MGSIGSIEVPFRGVVVTMTPPDAFLEQNVYAEGVCEDDVPKRDLRHKMDLVHFW